MAGIVEIRISVFSLAAAAVYISWYFLTFGNKAFASSNNLSLIGIISICVVFISCIHLFVLNSLPLFIIPITLMFKNAEGFQDGSEEKEEEPAPVTYTQEMCENVKKILDQYLEAKEKYADRKIKGLKEALNTITEQLNIGGCERFGIRA